MCTLNDDMVFVLLSLIFLIPKDTNMCIFLIPKDTNMLIGIFCMVIMIIHMIAIYSKPIWL